jgi:acyl-homoserine lactone acylase PvdQ
MAVELTPKGPRAVTLSAPGQSESSESPHYKDQLGLFREWKYKPFVYRRDEMK